MDKAFDLVIYLGLFFLVLAWIIAYFVDASEKKFIVSMILASFALGLFVSILIIKTLIE